VVETLRLKWPDVRTEPTTGPGTAAGLAARAIEAGAGMILVAGGDGTMNECLDGVAGTNVPFGLVPFGTANVLSNELGLGNSPLRAARRLTECQPVPVALGRMITERGTRRFLCMAGVGLDAYVARRVNSALKLRIGKVAYWLQALRQAGSRLPEFKVRVAGREHRASFALISRVRNYGGDLVLARNANLLEDHFAVVLFQGANASRYLGYLLGVVSNTAHRMDGVTMVDATQVEVEPLDQTQQIERQVDGEPAGEGRARFEITESGVRLMVPAPFVSVMTPAAVRLQPEPL